MEQLIKSTLQPKTKSDATLKNRSAYIFLIYRLLESDAKDLSFLNNQKAVMALVMNSENVGTRKTRLFHISEICKADKSGAIKPDVKKYYAKQADQLRPLAAKHEATNVMNEKQLAAHISIASANLQLEAYLIKHFKEYGLNTVSIVSDEDYERITTLSRHKNQYTFAKGVQECLIPALYVWQTALRNDWAMLEITRKIIIPNTGNWLQIKKSNVMFIHLNEYKNSKHFGKVKFQLDHKLNQLMVIWLALLERILGAKPKHPLYYSINALGKVEWIQKEETLAKQLSRISMKIWGRPSTINTFRHAHEMMLQDSEDYKRMTVDEKAKAHARLLHGLTTGLKYNLLRRD